MLDRLVNIDWEEAFKEATCNGIGAVINSNVPLDVFYREDVEKIFKIEDGESDGEDWIILGKLYDGRCFCLRAGCCYTGWD